MKTAKQHSPWAILALLSGALLIFAPMMYRWRVMGDFEPHARIAEQLLQNAGEFFRNVPHFLYHLLTALVHVMAPVLTVADAGFVVMLLAELAVVLILYVWLRSVLAVSSLRAGLLAVVMALLIAIVAPVNLLTPETLYFGYLVPHVYHNPTIILMKPFALLVFIQGVLAIQGHIRAAWWQVLLTAILTVLCIVAKPSFIIILLPALALLTLWRLITRRPVGWLLLLGGIVIPAGAILVYQTFAWTSSGGIALAPLETFLHWSIHYDVAANQNLLPRFFLSIAFPLLVLLFYFRRAVRDTMLVLAWVCFSVGAAYTYLLADLTAIEAGDFTWSGQAGTFILFAASAVFLMKQNLWLVEKTLTPLRSDQLRLLVPLLALGLHLVAGIHWYWLHFTQPYLDLIYRWW